MKNKRGQIEILFAALLLLGLIALIALLVASWDGMSQDEKNNLAGKYVREIYPEFASCDIEYSTGLNDCPNTICPYYNGVKVYCDNQTYDDRDSLRIGRPSRVPTLQIQFKNITIEEIKNYYKVRDKK